MSNSTKPNNSIQLLAKSILLSIVCFSGLLAAIGNWRPSIAQVVDWCSQPGILWCTSHEEPEFSIGQNLASSGYSGSGTTGWYASGGFIDRNESEYPANLRGTTPFLDALAAKITQATTAIPARSGETSTKRYLSFSLNTNYNQSPPKYNEGIFLSRPISSGTSNLITAYPNGLYYSAWLYFPQNYEATNSGNDTMMVMEFMSNGSTVYSPTTSLWIVPWSIHLQKKPNSSNMGFRVDEWSGTFITTTTPYTHHFNVNGPNVSLNRWVHLEVFYQYKPVTGTVNMGSYYRGGGEGKVIVFQDGNEIYRFENVATRNFTTTQTVEKWMITAYANTVSPNPFQFYVDDVAISTVRLGLFGN